MNRVATTGKNVQTESAVGKGKGAYETGLVSPSSPHSNVGPFSSSLAKQQRTLISVPGIPQPQPRTARNYGGRKLRYRWFDDLKPWQLHQLHEADAVADRLGFPLNMFVTINYHGTFPGGAAMASTFKRAMKCLVQWFRDKGLPAAYLYVHENPGDTRPNTHLLVHVPARLLPAFTAKCTDWFDAFDGGVRVDPRNDAERLAKGIGTRLQYMGKGAHHLVNGSYLGRRAKGGQGPIAIKRAGIAQCLTGKVEFRLASMREGFRDQYAHAREETRFLAVDNGSRGAV